jgi:hypothetical protein
MRILLVINWKGVLYIYSDNSIYGICAFYATFGDL